MKTILIIDDDQQLRTVFALALTRNGYHVVQAKSGIEGLEKAKQHLPDLILSDIHMPGGDGSTLLNDIRRTPELRSRPVVLMTGRPDLVTARDGMEQGADDFLVKPVSFKALISCVEARLSRASISWRVEDDMLAKLRSNVPPNLPHEVFTPLAGIIGLMEILRGNFPEQAPEEVQDIHNDIYQSALRLNRTLRNYLQILDLQTGQLAAAKMISPLEVEASIKRGVEEALSLNDRKDDITVRVNACSISVKASDLSHMVEELVDNACKFSRAGTPVNVEFEADGRLTINDEGRGLTTEEITQIGAFHQFDRKKHEQQGLGLGLVLVQKLALQGQAKFSLDSQPGNGTNAQIVFPLALAG